MSALSLAVLLRAPLWFRSMGPCELSDRLLPAQRCPTELGGHTACFHWPGGTPHRPFSNSSFYRRYHLNSIIWGGGEASTNMPYEPCVCTRAHMWDHEGKSHPWAALTLSSKDDAKAPPNSGGPRAKVQWRLSYSF